MTLWCLHRSWYTIYHMGDVIPLTKEVVNDCKCHFQGGCDFFFLFFFERLIPHQRSSKIWVAEDFDLCQNMTFCLRKESLVTQLKANVTLVIAPHNVNHPHGEAHAKPRDRVICDIEVSPSHCCSPSLLSVVYKVIGCSPFAYLSLCVLLRQSAIDNSCVAVFKNI